MSTVKNSVISAFSTGAATSLKMGPKYTLLLCLVCVLSSLCVEAQKDGRRRSGRRKPTTEIPPPIEEPENENNPQKLDADTEAIAKPVNVQPLEAEISATPLSKDHNNSSGGGPPFIVPRGTRKPRPMVTRGNPEGRPKPTLPTFTRKSQGRMPKPDRHDFNKKVEENQLGSSTTSTTTQKPSRNSSRRRNISQASEKSVPSTGKSDAPSEASTEASPKKRFGGGRRQSRGGSRRISTAAPEA